MSEPPDIPRAARAFVDFVALLRAQGFAIAPDQTTSFLAAIGLLGPRSMQDIRQAGLATLAPPPERRATYDTLFRLHFLGGEPLSTEGDSDETLRIQEDARGQDAPLSADEVNESGRTAARAEALVERRFADAATSEPLRRLVREAQRRLPLRRGNRRMPARRGPFADLRRTLRESVRNDGEFLKLSRLRRRPRAQTVGVDRRLRLHETSHGRQSGACPCADAVDAAGGDLHLRHPTDAGDARAASQATRAGVERAAAILVISDGLERGDVAALRDAAATLSRHAWALCWLTPLATTRAFTPQTAGLLAIQPFVDAMMDGGSTEAIVAHILSLRDRRVA